MIEEKPSQNRQQDTGTNPKPIAPISSVHAEIPFPQPVVAPRQAASHPTGDTTTNREEEIEEIEKGMSAFERKMIPLTWFGLAIAAITGVFLYSQFRVMTDQTKILSDQNTSAVAGAIESERNMRAQIKVMQDQVNAIQKQMRQDQRPYIGITLGGPGPGKDFGIKMSGSVLHLPLKMTVLGKTPARHVHGRLFLEIVKINQDPLLEKNTVPALDTFAGIVFPNVPEEFDAVRIKPKKGNKLGEFDLLKDSEASDVLAYRSYLAAYGTYTYDDAFDIKHWTKFCVSFHVNGPIVYPTPACVRYNEVDNNQ